MLSGTVNIGGHEWKVIEERRGGPQAQLFSLTAAADPKARMQIRLGAGHEAKTLEDVGLYAADPAVRWFADEAGQCWEARIVVHTDARGLDRELIKFISDDRDVREGAYGMAGGLGLRTDAELRQLLANAT